MISSISINVPLSPPRVSQHAPRKYHVLRRRIANILSFARLLPMRQPTIDKSEGFLFRMFFDPTHVFRGLPPMQRMRERNGRAHHDMMQYHERWQSHRRTWLCET